MDHNATLPTTALLSSQANSNNIKLLQINLQKAKTANDQLTQHLQENPADFITIQEPYCIHGQVARIPRQWTIIQQHNTNHTTPPRAAIIFTSNRWNPTIITCQRDIITISIKTKNSELMITSIYIAPTDDPTPALNTLSQVLHQHQCPHIISGDFNSQNTVWGYQRTNPRGTQILDFINANNLILHNQESDPPSFDNIYTQGWTDLQLTTTHLANRIQNRNILNEHTESDHKYITLEISEEIFQSTFTRFKINNNKARKFQRLIKPLIEDLNNSIEACTTKQERNQPHHTRAYHKNSNYM
ncbi:uncharacterized protein LOC118187741 [Stegodyphus dumicola]|uniref:uncharacterized protein LOC118187741 n=1 Tax=Stegodyphus dumicola TaxID=202533 RepID=UPI0015AFB9C1|nr:uncharacterized protein LOC118187741 [Stegodyphus dumicola]